MPKIESKQAIVNEIKEKINNAKSVVLVNSRGLTVEQDTLLRKKLREVGIEYKVYKNTLMELAFKGTDFERLKDYLKGPSAVVICYDDATVGANIINKEMKDMPVIEFKAGVIDNVLYDADGVKVIASIPSRDELLSKLLGSFKAPMASFARVINAIAEKNGETV